MNDISSLNLGTDSPGRGLVLVSFVATIVAFLFVAARLAVQAANKKEMSQSDWLISFALVADIGLASANIVAVNHGYGSSRSSLAPADISLALWAFLSTQVLYKFAINLTKLSVCFLLLQIFCPPGAPSKALRRAIRTVMFLVAGYGIGSIFATILQCVPVARFVDKTIPGTCFNTQAFWWTNALSNIVGDLTIVCLPLPAFYKLQMPIKKKIGAALVFVLGGAVIIVSAVRFITLRPAATAPDPLSGTTLSTLLTTVEANMAICGACLPFLRQPLLYLFARLCPSCFPRRSATLTSRATRSTASRIRRGARNSLSGLRNSISAVRNSRHGWQSLDPRDEDVDNDISLEDMLRGGPRPGPSSSSNPALHPGSSTSAANTTTNFQEEGPNSIPLQPIGLGIRVDREFRIDSEPAAARSQASGNSAVSVAGMV